MPEVGAASFPEIGGASGVQGGRGASSSDLPQVVLRSLTFSQEHSRLGKRTPSPQAAFAAASETVAHWQAGFGEQLKWPTVAEMEAVHAEVFGAP